MTDVRRMSPPFPRTSDYAVRTLRYTSNTAYGHVNHLALKAAGGRFCGDATMEMFGNSPAARGPRVWSVGGWWRDMEGLW